MAKNHKIAKAQKMHRRNRRKNWEKIEKGIAAELERKQKIKQLKKAEKTVEDIRKKAVEKAQKDRVRLAKKVTKRNEVKQIKKRITKNGETK